MYCSKCGKPMQEGKRFCAYCGAALNIAPAPVPGEDLSDLTVDLRHKSAADNRFVGTSPNNADPWQRAELVAERPRGYENAPGGAKTALSVFLCVLFFLSTFSATLVGAIRLTYRDENIAAMMDSYDAAELTMPVGGSGKTVSLATYIEDVCEVDFEEVYGITADDLEKVLNAQFTRDFLTQTITGYTSYLLSDGRQHPLTQDGVIAFFEENQSEIYDISGYSFTYGKNTKDPNSVTNVERNQVEDSGISLGAEDVKSAFDSLGTQKITWRWIERQTGIDIARVKTELSWYVLLGLCVFSVLLLAIIFLVNRKTLRHAFTFSGVTSLLSGGLLLLAAGAGCLVLMLTKNGIAQLLAMPLALRVLVIGGAIFVLGILLIVCRKIFGAKKKQADSVSF